MSERFERTPQAMQPEPESENTEQPTAPEAELSPEAIEKIMEKVQDINRPGLAINTLGGYDNFRYDYSYLHPEKIMELEAGRLESVLQSGIIGIPDSWPYAPISGERVKQMHKVLIKQRAKLGPWVTAVEPGHSFKDTRWADQTLSNKISVITGKLVESERRLDSRIPPRSLNGIVIINPYPQPTITPEESKILEEHDTLSDAIIDLKWERWLARFEKKDSVLANQLRARIGVLEKKSEQLQSRIKSERPELFDRIKKFNRPVWNDQSYKPNESDLAALTTKTSNIQLKIFEKNPESSLPIYNQSGNLLWPKQVSYEDVKKFVAERAKERPSDTPADTPHPNPLLSEGEGDKM